LFEGETPYLNFGTKASNQNSESTLKKGANEKIELVSVSALTKVNEQNILYHGNLLSYEMGVNNTLYCIYLQDARREEFDPTVPNKPNTDTRLAGKAIPDADVFVISGSEIVNMTVNAVYADNDKLNIDSGNIDKSFLTASVIQGEIKNTQFDPLEVLAKWVDLSNTSPPAPPPPSKEQG